MYICHTLIGMGSLVTCVRTWRSCGHIDTLQALHEWTLLDPEQSLRNCARTQKGERRTTASQGRRAKERERDRVKKMLCIQRQSSDHRCKVKCWPITRYCHCWISPVELDSGSVRLLLHGWQYIGQHLAKQYLADLFIKLQQAIALPFSHLTLGYRPTTPIPFR